MFDFIKRRLGHKIMVAIIISISMVMAVEIAVRLYFGTKDRIGIVTNLSKELAAAVYAGIRYPMSRGDGEAVKRQLADIREQKEEVEVFICDFDQEVIYSTHEERLKTRVEDSIHNEEALRALGRALETGIEPKRSLEDEAHGRRYLVTIQPINNKEDCHHCHGSSRKILGCVVMRMDVERAYGSVAAARNRTILIGIIGISAIIALLYAMLTRFVRRPVENLAEKAKRLADGDMSVSVDVQTEDEIGVLGNTFNYMVGSISSFSKKLEQEVTKKTGLLNEISQLVSLLERSNKKLQELDTLKSSFLANMSHELRTPMNSIIGYTDLLLEGIDGPINEEQTTSLKKVSNNAKHLLELINDILNISKIESGKAELMPKEIDLKSLVDSVIPALEPLMAQKSLTLTIDLDENASPVYADPDKIKQVLINLLSNAIKFTNQGGVTVTARPSERGVNPGDPPIFAEICVEDMGVGIEEEDLGKIFDKFVQADLSLVRQYEGTGLGLSIARGLVGLHKGVMWATSEPGKGSRFYFTIPLRKELLERPAEPVIETKMAEGLAERLDVPAETFLRRPQYAGKPTRCREYIHCGQPSCPAYGSEENRCWLILGTHCAGMKIGAYPEKVEFCKGCEVIKRFLLEPQGATVEEVEPTTEGGEAGKRTVLAIDDNQEAIDIIRKYLGGDYRVIGLLSGRKAVEKAKELKPLAITLDIMMPEKDGWEVLRELKSTPETQDIPVIVVSIVDKKGLGFSLGAAEYILKPVDRNTLLQKVRSIEKAADISNVLIVENDQDTANLCANFLKEEGYRAMVAEDSKQAIESIRELKPDLIILNLTMLDVESVDILEYIKTEEKARSIPLIIITRRDLTKEELEKLNGRIRGILDRKGLEEDFLNGLKDTLLKCRKMKPGHE